MNNAYRCIPIFVTRSYRARAIQKVICIARKMIAKWTQFSSELPAILDWRLWLIKNQKGNGICHTFYKRSN